MEKPNIFVANDDAEFLDLMQELLQDEGYDVTTLHASDDAYDEIKAATPNLVTLDMTLEHPDAGWLVLQLLKLDPATVGTPVIICSADVALLRERYDKIRALGCYIVEKPFDLDILLDTVRQALVSR